MNDPTASPKRKRQRAQQGFTLIELLVVVTIIGILAAIAVVQTQHATKKAQEAALRADLSEMRKAIDNFYADKQRYPQDLKELVPHYLRMIPKDPITKNDDWEEVTADTSDEQTQADQATSTSSDAGAQLTPGIVDVKSRATGSTLDHVPYHDL